MKIADLAPLFILLTAACGGGGTAPTIAGLMVGTSSIARGMTSSGSVDVTDADGLAGLKLELAFTGPTAVTSAVDVQGASSAITSASVPFVFGLTAAAAVGSYTMGVTAIDDEDLRSNTLSATLEVR